MTSAVEPNVRRFKPYPAYKDSGVEWLEEIPADWAVLSLKRVVDPVRPVTYGIVQCGPDLPEGVPYIRPVDMADESGVDPGSLQRTAPEIAAAYSRSRIRPGDIVVSIGPSFGKAMVVPDALDGANLTQGTARVAPGCGVLGRFLFWVLRSAPTRQAWDSYCSGATFRALTLEILESCEIVLPHQDGQRAIAAFLDRETARIDALVAKKERLIELLQEKRTALITHAVTRGLDPNAQMRDSGVEWLGEIPAHWEINRLKYILAAPLKYGANEAAEIDDPDLPRYVRITDIDESDGLRDETFKSLPAEVAEEYLLQEGDLLFARSGATAGKTFLYRSSWGVCAYAGYLIRARLDAGRAYPEFVRYFTASSAYWQWLSAAFIQATIQNVSADRYASLLVPQPPIREQRDIATFLDRETAKLDALVAKVREAIERLKEFRTALISAAVTGKIDVRDEVAA